MGTLLAAFCVSKNHSVADFSSSETGCLSFQSRIHSSKRYANPRSDSKILQMEAQAMLYTKLSHFLTIHFTFASYFSTTNPQVSFVTYFHSLHEYLFRQNV